MKKVFSSDDLVMVGFYRAMLEERGIDCMVRNEFLGAGAGELPLNETWPELWVIDPRDEGLAKQLIESQQKPLTGKSWICETCGEKSEPQFAACWQCGAARPI